MAQPNPYIPGTIIGRKPDPRGHTHEWVNPIKVKEGIEAQCRDCEATALRDPSTWEMIGFDMGVEHESY